VRCIAFSKDGKTLAVGRYLTNYSLEIWDVATRKEIGHFHVGWTETLAFPSDGKSLVYVEAGRIRVWDLAELMKEKPKP
jgi:WD40 repeat protein